MEHEWSASVYNSGPWVGFESMDALIPVVSIVMGSLLIITIVCGIVLIGFVKALRGGGATRVQRRVDRQEAQAFQELERGFRRLEERIDSLETLLMGRSQRAAADREFS